MNTNKLDRISPNAKLHHDETFSAICPLSEAQRAVYLDCLEEPGSDSYIVIYDNMLTGDIDVKRFMECIKRSVANHPVNGKKTSRIHSRHGRCQVCGDR